MLQIQDQANASLTLPTPPPEEIYRENIVSIVDEAFRNGVRVFVVDGLPGYGKTTLLAQFVRSHADAALSLFVSPNSKSSYDSRSVQLDIANQIEWLLRKQDIQDLHKVDDVFFTVQIAELRRHVRRFGKTVYFVLDGLDEIPETDRETCKAIIACLPFEDDHFRFLLSGSPKVLPMSISAGKEHSLAGFTLDEATRYLSGQTDDHQFVATVYRMVRGRPGGLASIRRLLLRGVDPRDLTTELSGETLDLLKYEWDTVDEGDANLCLLLEIVALDKRSHTVESLSTMLALDENAVRHSLESLRFMQVEPTVAYVEEPLRQYAMSRLGSYSRAANARIVDDLSQRPESAASLTYLPDYLEQSERYTELLAYLSPANFVRLLEHTQSLGPLKSFAQAGIRISYMLKKDDELVRFIASRALLESLSDVHVPSYELKALLALKEYDIAVSLAQGATLLEDRLQMLAAIARSYKEQGLLPTKDLLERIQHLVTQIDPGSLGMRAFSIATDLLYSFPALAKTMVEAAARNLDDSPSLRKAYAELDSEARRVVRDDDVSDHSLSDHLVNPAMREYWTQTAAMISEYNPSQVIEESKRFPSVEDQIYLLRLWCKRNKQADDAAIVLQYGLRLAIGATHYTANARAFRELAEVLPFCDNADLARELVASLDGQIALLSRLGPTEDLVRLKLLLAKAASRFGLLDVPSRVLDTFWAAAEAEDLETRATCLGMLLAALPQIDPERSLEQPEQIHSATKELFDEYITSLLESSADHLRVTRRIVRALAMDQFDVAIAIIQRVNTESRRDRLYLELIDSMLTASDDKVNLAAACGTVSAIRDTQARDVAVLIILERLGQATACIDALAKEALRLTTEVDSITDSGLRCRALCLAYSLLSRCTTTDYQSLRTGVKQKLQSAWSAIDASWNKVDLGFMVAEEISHVSLDYAREWHCLASDEKTRSLFDTSGTAIAYIQSVCLAIRAFAGLFQRNLDQESDLERVREIIEHVPSAGDRALLWSDLALRYHRHGRLERCASIVEQHVWPIVRSAFDGRVGTLVFVAPALYCANQVLCIEELKGLAATARDEACVQVCRYLLCRQLPLDPQPAEPDFSYSDCSWQDVQNACLLVDGITHDSAIHHVVRAVGEALIGSAGRDKFKDGQCREAAAILRRLLAGKLPDPSNITHQGYVIACQTVISQLEHCPTGVWEDLANRAREIPNSADQSLLLSWIAAAMPGKPDLKTRLWNEAAEVIASLPCHYDRMVKLQYLASGVYAYDRGMAKAFLRRAMVSAVERDDPDYYASQRRIIDLAHRIDPEFASELASSLDDDPASARAKANVQGRLRMLASKRSLADDEDDAQGRPSDLPAITTRFLEALSCGRMATLPLAKVRLILKRSESLEFDDAYPVLRWSVENVVQKYSRVDGARVLLRGLFEATMQTVTLADCFAAKAASRLRRTLQESQVSSGANSTVICAGRRAEGLQFIRDWLASKDRSYIKIHDPYFGCADLPLLQLIREVSPSAHVQIMTSKAQQDHDRVSDSIGEKYSAYWRAHVADQDPPDTDIVVVDLGGTAGSPIHDRWWVGDGDGLAMGTSFKSVGIDGTTELRILGEQEARSREQEIDQYLSRRKRDYNGMRLTYRQFTLV